jgi:NitT/TauT family transport system permease protein
VSGLPGTELRVERGAVSPSTQDARARSAVKFRWSRLPLVARRAILLLIALVVWGAYTNLRHVSPLVFSSPQAAIGAFGKEWANGHLASATATTLEVLLIGMAVGLAAGIVLTCWATWTTIGQDFLALFTSMLNPLPSIAILPLAIIWFGLSEKALVFVIANAVVWPVAINISTGFRTVNPTLLMVGRNLGLRGWRLAKDVLVVAALPSIVSGIKVSWAFAWRTVIAAELVFGTAGGSGGLGFYINKAQYFLHIQDVFAGLITIAVIGIFVESLLNRVEKRTVVRWGMKGSA